MAAVTVTLDDLEPFAEIPPAKATEMIADALARAAVVAPCILEDDFAHAAAAKAIIRGAILRWHDAGSGAFSQQTAGPFGAAVDTRVVRKGMFLPSEVDELKSLCGSSGSGGVFDVDTVGTSPYAHAETCSLYFGADYCSCGAVLAGVPLWEL